MDPLKIAKQVAELVEQEADRRGISVTFCAIDAHGNLILKHRMPGANLISIEMSERKAYTCAALPVIKTADMTLLARPGESLYTFASVAGGRYTVLGGGVPLRIDGTFVAGIGVSGGTTEQDVEIVEAAVARLGQVNR
ncbi:hypothetical protein NGR_b01050 (plasmid) [Sinorhizobium fredii NGR234]|uniref:Heme-binding protein n=1 Tax=Sinorhizobium fredii (strain NBRC 101917 / NGR234) TaxID=394 RepID=C3KMZ9_SINFN|nr:heme-binding protein [Sinorhizobium fredii]ACP21572.1 hypothetical protein NGR_b01050 [Sinorhizobium fredii NGR234]